MTDLKSQKQMAAKIMKCGVSRVWIDPLKINDISESITNNDIRKLVKDGIIKPKPKKGNSTFRIKKIKAQKKKGRRKGIGKRKGHVAGAKKKKWMSSIRALRILLDELKKEKKIEVSVYRKTYRMAKSGFFRSKMHLVKYLQRNNMLEESYEIKKIKKEKRVLNEKSFSKKTEKEDGLQK